MPKYRKHRATGNPVGRPRTDPNTGLVKPDWRFMAEEFGVSRSTISRQMVNIHRSGRIQRVFIPCESDPRIGISYYRVI